MFPNIVDYLSSETSRQSTELSTNGRYIHIPRTRLNGIYSTVTEYKTPSNEVGYQVIFFATINRTTFVKAIANGPESEIRTFDWNRQA